jgi:hypothetical protein
LRCLFAIAARAPQVVDSKALRLRAHDLW